MTALVLLTVMMGLGLGLLFLTDSQQKASGREQASESAFNVAEGALNAQISQLSHSWPGKEPLSPEAPGYIPPSCTASTTTATNGCPDKGSLEVGYPNISPVACPAGMQADPWGSSTTNQWTTYVRDDIASKEGEKWTVEPFNSATEQGQVRWDKNEDGKVWVRSVGVIQCRLVTIVTLVSEQLITATFPSSALDANWFTTSNKGNKVIINTEGNAAQPAEVSMRCAGKTLLECTEYRPGQVKPETTKINTGSGEAHAISTSELEGLKKVAISQNTFFPRGAEKCPTSAAAASGLPVYVEGLCELRFKKGDVINSATSPGFLVLVSGTFELTGGAEFFGTVYARDAQQSPAAVVTLQGTSKLTGSILVDEAGGIQFGSSGNGNQENENFVYNSKSTEELKTFAGASATRNSFRVLPANQ